MVSFTNLVKRAQFLKTMWSKVAKPLKVFTELPRVVKLGLLAVVVVCLAFYVYKRSGDVTEALLLLGIVALVAGGLWFVTRLVNARQKRQADEFDEQFSSTEMLEDLRGQWNRAVGELGSAGVDRYNMAFYMLIGEPQSGKTTTLQKSGLNFPIGMDKIQGIGGTRNLDWWFTDEAVILDTAGRLTFQDEGQTDEEEWTEFLGLLRRYRPKCPINGVIVTIPCTSLLEDDADERERKAQVIRSALVQIERNLEVQYPVYVLVTKADRVGGFAEFFGKLRAMEQTQLLGWSRPKERFGAPFSGDEAKEAFQGLVGQMRRWRIFLMDQLADELTPEERDRMYPFPEEFALLEQPLAQYLESIFPESRLLDPLFFRGFYITSGLQKGVPVLDACARILGGTPLGTQLIERQRIVAEKAYFIRDFYRKKVFRERGLIVPTKQRVRRVVMVKKVGYVAASIAAVLGTFWVTVRYIKMRDGVTEPVERFAALEDAHQPFKKRGALGMDPLRRDSNVEGLLTALRKLGGAGPNEQFGVEGMVPRILAGELLSADSFLRVAGDQEGTLHRNIRRAIRATFNEDVVLPLAARVEQRLEELGRDKRTAENRLSTSLDLRSAALADIASMLVERDRAQRLSDPSGTGSSLDAPPHPPADLDAFFRLTLSDESWFEGDTPQLQLARNAYALLRHAASDRSEYERRYVDQCGDLAGLGLSYAWYRGVQRYEMDAALATAMQDIKQDFLGALDPSGDANAWFDLESFVQYRHAALTGDDPDEATAAVPAIRDTGQRGKKTRGYVALRAAALEDSIRKQLESLLADERTLLDGWQGQAVVTGNLADLNRDLETFRDSWASKRSRLTESVGELEMFLQAAAGADFDLDESLVELARPLNEAYREVHQILRIHDQQSETWSQFKAVVEGEAEWISFAAGNPDNASVASARSALSPSDDEFDLVHIADADGQGLRGLQAAPALTELKAWLDALEALTDSGDVWPSATQAALDRVRETADGLAGMPTLSASLRGRLTRDLGAAAADSTTDSTDLARRFRASTQELRSAFVVAETRIALGQLAPELSAAVGGMFESAAGSQADQDLDLDAISAAQLKRRLAAVNDVTADVIQMATEAAALVDSSEDSPVLMPELGALTAALDVAALASIERWNGVWKRDVRNQFTQRLTKFKDLYGDWRRRCDDARALADQDIGAENWARYWRDERARHLGALVGAAGVYVPLEADLGEGVQAVLPKTYGYLGELSRILAKLHSLRGGEAKNDGSSFESAVGQLARLIYDQRADFGGTKQELQWKMALTVPGWVESIQQPLSYFERSSKRFTEGESTRELNENDYKHTEWFVSGVVNVLRSELITAVNADMRSDYGELQVALTSLGFPFDDVSFEGKLANANRLSQVLGQGGRLSKFVESYRAVGLLDYVHPPISGGESPSSAAGEEGLGLRQKAPLGPRTTVSRWRDIQDLYLYRVDGKDVDETGARTKTRESTWRRRLAQKDSLSGNADDAAIVFSVATRESALRRSRTRSADPDGDLKDVVHLEAEAGAQDLVWGQDDSDLFLCVTSKVKDNPRDRAFTYRGWTAFHQREPRPGAGPDQIVSDLELLHYRGAFPFLQLLRDMRQSTQGKPPEYAYGAAEADRSRSTTITVPISVNVDPSKAGAVGQESYSAELKLEVVVQGVFVPEVPIQLSAW